MSGTDSSDSSADSTSVQDTSGTGASSWSPNKSVSGLYDSIAQNLYSLYNTEVPYYSGQTYVSPSELTQQGVATGQTAAEQYKTAGQTSQMAANPYMQSGQSYGQAGQLIGQAVNPYMQSSQAYGQAGNAAAQAYNPYMQSSQAYGQAAGAQNQIAGNAVGNYNYLSNAADVANNQQVQDLLKANAQSVTQQLNEEWLPSINAGANSVNALGSSRQGIAQAQGVERAANQLSRTNAQTLMDAYSQGLGAQQNALSQTGALQQAQTAGAGSLSQAGQQATNAAGALGNQAQYYGLGGQAVQNAAGALGQQGQYYGQGGQAVENASKAQATGAEYTNQASGIQSNLGQTVESYQQKALDEAVDRYNYQYEEPWTRMSNISNYLTGLFGDTGTSYTSSTGSGNTTGASDTDTSK